MNSLTRRRLLRKRYQRRSNRLSWILVALLGLAALGSVGVAGAVGTVYYVYNSYARDYVPIDEKLAQTNLGLTEIYDRGGPESGVLLGKLTNLDAQLLAPVTLDHISQNMVNATVSTEDNSFWDHPGINIRGILRAAYENYVGGGIGSGTGGSSITQQLIKNVYICPSVSDEKTRCTSAERTVDRKLREIAYAIELERDYSKEQILEWYLNQISYADRYIGVEAAAQGYFHKSAADLTLAEAAMLSGIPAYPTLYHPRLNCLKDGTESCIIDADGRTTITGPAKQRQEDVLDLMVTHNRATRAEVEAAKAEPLKVYAASNPIKSAAFIDNQVEPRLVRMCEAGVLPRIEGATDCVASVHAAGYKVTTTLDWQATDWAQQMLRGYVSTGLEAGCECYNAAVVTIEPTTGQVIVYAPNRDPTYVSDRRVAGDIDQLTEINQPGSSFKPAVYLTWFDQLGKAPMSIFWDTSPLTVAGTAITNPRSGDPKSEGLISARAALGGSQNVGAFRAAYEAGVDNVIEMAKKLGITTLEQNFDPTFRSHPDVSYGASIATGGANIRAIDMAYMNATIANMGVMVGVPHLARVVELKSLRSTALDEGEAYDLARKQALDFARGHIRIPGTRELDPVVVLQVKGPNGEVLFTQGEPERKEVVNPGSVWLLHSIMSDCTARFIIWGCGGSNNDLALDSFMDNGARIPTGVKTGTQQGPKSAADTLATWMNGYSRYAATAVWFGNATKELVRDGPGANYAAANTTVRFFKNWTGWYHSYLRDKGVFETPAGFDSLRPKNVAQQQFSTPATDRGLSGGCDQKVVSWVRTDVTYGSDCEEKEIDTRNGLLASDQTPAQFREKRKFVKLPSLKPELATELVKEMKEKNIPIAPTEKSTGQTALAISNLTNGKTVSGVVQVVGSVQTSQLKSWKLEIGAGSNPSEWKQIGGGNNPVSNAIIGVIDTNSLQNGVYTVRLTAEDAILKTLKISVTINVKKGPATPSPTTQSGGIPWPGWTPSATPEP
ncbi:MAG: transglycosylase domain-containing protein [Dehalococcoidia bacterium]|nr:transglycosylase domain-containing protein [Dehalococcoidia bacterium]